MTCTYDFGRDGPR